MFLQDSVIIENRESGDKKYYLLRVKVEKGLAESKPGQFFMLKCNDGSRILRRPISLHYADKENGILEFYYEVVGKGTKEFTFLNRGDAINIQGPLGNGFDTDIQDKNVLVIGGGMGIAPLKYLIEDLKTKNNLTFIAGGRDSGALNIVNNIELKGFEILETTDDGTRGRKGNTVELMKEILEEKEIDIIYTCGPHGMIKAVAQVAASKGIRCQVSLEERMACGTGACMGCSIETTKGMRKVCKDGPVFESLEVSSCNE